MYAGDEKVKVCFLHLLTRPAKQRAAVAPVAIPPLGRTCESSPTKPTEKSGDENMWLGSE